MEPERAAEIIVGAILKGKARQLVGIDAHLIHHAASWSASRYQDVIARYSQRHSAHEVGPPLSGWAHAPGTPVEVAMTKWRDLPHWEYSAVFLGSDLYGDWIGIPAGTPMRARRGLRGAVDQVGLVPPGARR